MRAWSAAETPGPLSLTLATSIAGRLLGANTFTLRRFPWFGNNVTQEQWTEWQRRPRVYHSDVDVVRNALPSGTRYAVESSENLYASTPYSRPRQIDAHAVEGDYFAINTLPAKFATLNMAVVAANSFGVGRVRPHAFSIRPFSFEIASSLDGESVWVDPVPGTIGVVAS